MSPSAVADMICTKPDAMASLLLFVALREARRIKWEESRKARRDVGQKCVVRWFQQNWAQWYRDHWVEHIYGKKFWEEFGQDGFNLVKDARPNECLFKDILAHVEKYGENLGIIQWALNTGQDLSQVKAILHRFDINERRAYLEEEYIETLAHALDEAEKHKWIESQKAGRDLGEAAIMDWFRKNWPSWYSRLKTRAS